MSSFVLISWISFLRRRVGAKPSFRSSVARYHDDASATPFRVVAWDSDATFGFNFAGSCSPFAFAFLALSAHRDPPFP